MTEIINEIYNMIDKLINQSSYQKLKKMNEKIMTLYSDLINDYQNAKKKYDEVMEIGSYHHPDFKESAANLSKCKKELFEKLEVKEILALEKEIELQLNDLMSEIAKIISKQINTPNELGLIRGKKGENHVNIKKTIYR